MKPLFPKKPPRTLAETICYLPLPQLRAELEAYRVEYESRYGQTDLTRRYTSTWPPEQQEWLIRHDIKRYFDGLPPFAKAFFKGKMELASRAGNLDDMPDGLLRLYVTGNMILHADNNHRD
jgi:hypothetical protein